MERLPHVAHYRSSYDTRERFISYWHQINEILSLGARSVLEIGVGTSTVTAYLRRLNLRVTTLDLEKELRPTVQGTIEFLPFRDNSFDTVTACQVIEHLPFEKFQPIMRELLRVSNQHVIVSLPNAGRAYRVHLELPLLGNIKRLVELSSIARYQQVQGSPQHYWELEIAGYKAAYVKKLIEESGGRIVKDFRVFENPYYQFLVIRKISSMPSNSNGTYP